MTEGGGRSSAGKVTAGLAKSNSNLPPGNERTLGSAPNPTFGNDYGKTLRFYFLLQWNVTSEDIFYSKVVEYVIFNSQIWVTQLSVNTGV